MRFWTSSVLLHFGFFVAFFFLKPDLTRPDSQKKINGDVIVVDFVLKAKDAGADPATYVSFLDYYDDASTIQGNLAYSSYSGCRQYRENIEEAKSTLADNIPETDKIRVFYNHPGFVNTIANLLIESLNKFDESAREKATILFTDHSIPDSMAANCSYASQLNETARLVMQEVGENPWHLVYQSRSGAPSQPWLEPDVCDFLESLNAKESPSHLAVVPIGFISDHMEVMFDLDIEAKEMCEELNINMVRVPTVGTSPQFVKMIVELIRERTENIEKRSLGDRGPSHDVCPIDCCLYTPKRPPIQGRRGGR